MRSERRVHEIQRDPLVGKVLCDRFEIVAPLGTGGMGQVYRALQRPLGREVAVKVLKPRLDGTCDPKLEERFFFEAATTAKLAHPNIVAVHDYGRTDDGLCFMALELLDGRTLQQLLAKEGPLPWPRALAVGGQVARALREAHLHGVVHRDLKPSNIIVTPGGASGDLVKLLDFGLVKSLRGELAAANDVELTAANVVLGSPLYMSPEQARKEVDPRSDVYSLGVVMYATMAGRTPFLGKTAFELLAKHLNEKPPELSSLVELPPVVNDLVMRCLAKAPEGRFQSMDALLMSMHHAMEEQRHFGLFVVPGLPPPILKRAGDSITEQRRALPSAPPRPLATRVGPGRSLATARPRAPTPAPPVLYPRSWFWASCLWFRMQARAVGFWEALRLLGSAVGRGGRRGPQIFGRQPEDSWSSAAPSFAPRPMASVAASLPWRSSTPQQRGGGKTYDRWK